MPWVPRQLNELRIAQTLVSWPAHALILTKDRIDVRRYWYLEETPEARFESDEDYVERFLEIYTQAVRCRLRSHRPIAATLSGGLDSGSVCTLAARELRANRQRLPVYSSIPAFDTGEVYGPTRICDESPYINATARFAANIDIHYIKARDVTPLDGALKMLAAHDAPGHAATSYFWISEIFRAARQRGIGTLLTGQGGNASVSWTGLMASSSFFDQLRDGRVYLAFTRRLLPVIVRHWLRRALRVRRVQRELRNNHPPWRAYSPIHPDFAERMDLATRMAEAGHDPTWLRKPRDGREARFAVLRPGRNIDGDLYAELGGAYGIETRDPTIDKRLLEYCISIPDEQYSRYGRTDRWLVRRAMLGFLPNKVRLNTRRGLQSADIGHRIVASHGQISDALQQLEHSDLAREVLDVVRMKTVLAAILRRIDKRSTQDAQTILLRGLGVGLFLLRFDDIQVAEAKKGREATTDTVR